MTTLVLKTAGSVIGGALLGPVGAALGGALGASAGYAIDQSLFGSARSVEGPRLSDLEVQTSTEGAPIPRLYGRARLNGQIFWATNFIEKVTRREQKTGASKGGAAGSATATETTYSYYANFAVGLCEGEIAYVGRIWANGKILDLNNISYRVYRGTGDQLPDSLIEAKQGADACPAYRGLAYVVFENLPLEGFGNRIPQLSFEVVRSVGELENQVRSMVMIPGATEFGYDTTDITWQVGDGEWESENRHSYEPGCDFSVSLDHLMAICPNLQHIALVVTWFGSDLRASHCSIRPCVDQKTKVTDKDVWSVAGLSRNEALLVSQIDEVAAYGGTPSDNSVKRAIAAIKARGLGVVFYPFVMMDIPEGNGLADPYGGAEQASYPWRGHITCYPGPEQPDSANKTSNVGNQISAFFRDQEWGYRRFILHYAQLVAGVGGVDAFLLGSELRGLTSLQDDTGSYPFVSNLKSLAAEVRQTVGAGCKLTYGADWSEYFGHHPGDAPGTVRFHLDALWADENIDAVGIDNYMPLSDWRVGEQHTDAPLSENGLDRDYLQGNIAGGEGFDWYYASRQDRDNQLRTPITDGAAQKPWVFRYKDLVNWWSCEHYDRDSGVEDSEPTEWIPRSKPIWFTELGCPAVHAGINQPNVFPDPKSDESALPYYSAGTRDDAAQRAMLTASLAYWQERGGEENPLSALYGSSMVDPDHIYLWAWDARPFPAFPMSAQTWTDSENWQTGHWLNGRLGGAPLEDVLRTLLGDFGVSEARITGTLPVVDGFVLDRRMSARAALQDLCGAFGVSFMSNADQLTFQASTKRPQAILGETDLVELEDEPLFSRQLEAWESQISSATFSFKELFHDYRQSVARYDQPAAHTQQDSSIALAVVSTQTVMVEAAKNWLRRKNYARHTIKLSLPPSMLALEAGDHFIFNEDGSERSYHINEIEDGIFREVTASLSSPRNASPVWSQAKSQSRLQIGVNRPPAVFKPVFQSLDLPLLPGLGDLPHAPYLAIFAKPWPSEFALYSGDGDNGFSFRQTLTIPAIMGALESALPGREAFLWDHESSIDVRLFGGDLASVSEESLLSGANAAAVQCRDGTWEVMQFREAELVSPNVWRLSTMLRGLLGTELPARRGANTGACFLLLDDAIQPLDVTNSQLGKSLPHRLVPVGGGLNDESNVDVDIGVPGRGLVPLSPVHLKVSRGQQGADLEFSWIRRGRMDADSWRAASIPMDEEQELYQITIRSPVGDLILRQEESADASWLYRESDQLADGISIHSAIIVEVAQISRQVGAGDRMSRQVELSSLKVVALDIE